MPIKNSPSYDLKGFTDDWEQRKLSELTTMNPELVGKIYELVNFG